MNASKKKSGARRRHRKRTVIPNTNEIEQRLTADHPPIDILFAMFKTGNPMPKTTIHVHGLPDIAIFRTEFPFSVASRKLYLHLCRLGIKFEDTHFDYESGTCQRMLKATTSIPVELHDRRIEITIYAHSHVDAVTPPTMLGRDFLIGGSILIDTANRCYTFTSETRFWYPFEMKYYRPKVVNEEVTEE